MSAYRSRNVLWRRSHIGRAALEARRCRASGLRAPGDRLRACRGTLAGDRDIIGQGHQLVRPLNQIVSLDFAPTVQHAEDFDRIVANSIKRKVFPDNKVANARQDVVARCA
ncbi:hypothetical protein MPL3356_60636 [Mesorhizobium plurifarium]|uniref:Uncharacterized protein n=1 Tax=Mesorhizobium plurifarium TaxID=69974 RepID=A0A090EG24_MESPL|nr:hypothetical protein MPL3356_60636 [Mesorhizobium plurifarium]